MTTCLIPLIPAHARNTARGYTVTQHQTLTPVAHDAVRHVLRVCGVADLLPR